MDGSVFFYVGPALVASALVLAFLGLRGRESFPSRGAMVGLMIAFAALVVATGAFAWVNATDEQDKRNADLAKEQQQAKGEVAQGGQAQPSAGGGKPAANAGAKPSGGGGAATLDLTSPADGSLSFDPDTLTTNSSTITIAYDNPSPVQHNVAVEDAAGKKLGESKLAANAQESVTVTLDPGDYVYFCTVPGHRQAGMEGDLTVK